MHIAAANPLALRGEELDPALIERERAIAAEKAAEIAASRPRSSRRWSRARWPSSARRMRCSSQLFVIDNKTKVEDVVAAAAKEAGAPIALKDYVRFQLGEGIEKKDSDFAAEVAAAAGTREARAGRLNSTLGRVARGRLRCAPPCFLSSRERPYREPHDRARASTASC